MVYLFQALAVLGKLNMSVAVFGPAWTFEALPEGQDFLQREITFWKKCWHHLSIHGPAKLPFQTNFCQGISFDVCRINFILFRFNFFWGQTFNLVLLTRPRWLFVHQQLHQLFVKPPSKPVTCKH